MDNTIKLYKSSNKGKKYTADVFGRKVHFGATGYSDYTIHKDSDRKSNYISRHRSRENWKKSGINTAGFWSRWLLWNKPSITGSIKDIEQRFNVKIVRSK